MKTYTLTSEERAVIEQMQNEVNRLQNQLNGALLILSRSHGLDGQINYNNGTLTEKENNV